MLMDKARQLSILSALAHFSLVLAFVINTPFASNAAFTIFPTWFWPSVFAVQGLLSLIGFRKITLLRVSFYIGSCVMVGWSVATFFAALERNQFPGTAIWLLYIGGLKWLIAEYALKLQKIQKIARALDQNGTSTTN